MLLLPQAIYDRRKELWADYEADKLTDEAFYRALAEVDPTDYVGLVGVGKACREAGDIAGAQEYFWRAIAANPSGSEAYLDLARSLYPEPESRALAMGLGELGLLKQSREADGEEFLKSLDHEKLGLDGELLEKFQEFPAPVLGQLISRSMQESREDEPAPVAQRLKPLRLIERLQQGELSTETVDAIIAEGSSIVPLLVGLLRAWAEDLLDEGDDSETQTYADLENALALMGEIGSADEIPHLLEFVDLVNETAAGASEWALGRIVERHPKEAAKAAITLMPGLGFAERLKLAAQTLRCPEFDPSGKVLECAGENLEAIEKDACDIFFPLLVMTMVAARGREGISLARGALRRESGLLSRRVRRECDDILTACEEEGIPPKETRAPSPTIYEICAGDVSWDEEDEEDEEDDYLRPQEPIRRKATPGRNDPCWCNSGKKYKKCHLESDERKSRQP